jgi:thioredoxin reductase (NADPH)
MRAPAEPAPPIDTDALIIGAGPVGLFQAFELGLLEVQAQLVDSLPYRGGQCIELYPDKPIYDIPGLKVCSGRELVHNLLQQIEPFHVPFHLGRQVNAVQRRDDGRFDVHTTLGDHFVARAIIIAAGVGSFLPRLLRLPGLERHEGTQLFYQVPEGLSFSGQRVVIVGNGPSALDWALRLAEANTLRAADRVTLMHRREVFDAAPEVVERMHAACRAQRMQFIAAQATGVEETAGRLSGLQVAGGDGAQHTLALDLLLVFQGLSPKLGPLSHWGLAMERKQLVVDTERFETSEPGIFAVGDINTYPGKKKLIVCGFHEATLAAFAAAARVFPDKAIPLQYTTTSPRLHHLLGVDTPAAE